MGIRAPSAWNFFGFSRNSLISWSSSTASSTPATSLKPIFGESGAIRLARLLPKLITFEPPPCTWFMRKIQKAIRITNGRIETSIPIHENVPVPLESNLTLCAWSVSVIWGTRLVGAGSGPSPSCRPGSGIVKLIDRLLGVNSTLPTVPRLGVGEELGVRDLRGALPVLDQRLARQVDEQHDHEEWE